MDQCHVALSRLSGRKHALKGPLMNWLLFILHLCIGASLAGVGIVAVLVAGLTGAAWLWGAVLAGMILAFPVAWLVARAMQGD